MNDATSAAQFNNVQVASDPGARSMMDANSYTPSPISLSGNSLGSYNSEMTQNFAHAKGPGLKVKPYSAQTMTSSTYRTQ